MEELTKILLWRNIVATIVIYLSGLVIYRLFFHSLAKFRSSKLAAVTRYYYDVVQNGQYTFKIAKMHEIYGMSTVEKIIFYKVQN
jgi:cytochrome b subunit of formate dehydrogenase